MKLLVDVAKAVADSIVTPSQGEELKRAAAADTLALAINILLSVGVLAVSGGVLALRPPIALVVLLGVALSGGGLAVRKRSPAKWGFLGAASILIGALTISGGILLNWKGHALAFLAVSVILLTLGTIARSGLLVALTVFTFAGFMGSTTGYWHAAYALWVNEPTFTIIVFSAFSLLGLVLLGHLPADYERLVRIFARLSLVWVNFGFWVGSLWGDYPLSSWLELRYASRQEYLARLAGWPWIPADAFSVVWAVALLAAGVWGARQDRRFVVNTVAVFGGIHFYTQWFERLQASATSFIMAGGIAIAAATVLWRYN